MYLKRIASSNNRVTKGRIYVATDGSITDDQGNPMRPSAAAPGYWEQVTELAYTHQDLILKQPTNQEPKMLKVETVTLINGQRIDTFKVETLIGYIQKEEAHIEALEQVHAVSKAINSLKKRHQVNIKELVAILDKMEPEDE